ncbi:MAG: hypothetical protein E7072_09310 [Bacteroidales bacterium]|nr:hypothetical protein [Bacteroidales bacterium]MBO5133136.1 hypothetical protein [Paludibacteraceae bacterium]
MKDFEEYEKEVSSAEQFKSALDLAARKGMAVGYDEGYDEGFEKGVRKTNLVCAKRLFNLGIDLNIIEEVTEIPKDELEVMFK